jgi:hypothetical protein
VFGPKDILMLYPRHSCTLGAKGARWLATMAKPVQPLLLPGKEARLSSRVFDTRKHVGELQTGRRKRRGPVHGRGW